MSFLAVPLTEWYIDLKQNQLATTDEEILHTVEVAVAAIVQDGSAAWRGTHALQGDAGSTRADRQQRRAGGNEGLPQDTARATQSIVDAAAANGFEMVCIRITNLDKAMLDYSHARGVWHLGWELGERTPGAVAAAGRPGAHRPVDGPQQHPGGPEGHLRDLTPRAADSWAAASALVGLLGLDVPAAA